MTLRKQTSGEGEGGSSNVPGVLPSTAPGGQDWADWAREWKEDPAGKADRLLKQWERESAETKQDASSTRVGCCEASSCPERLMRNADVLPASVARFDVVSEAVHSAIAVLILRKVRKRVHVSIGDCQHHCDVYSWEGITSC